MAWAMESVIARRIIVRGDVQGVGFRWSCALVAEALGVAGYAANRRDGDVEVHAEGPPDAVAKLVDWCRTGPRHAIVTGVEVSPAEHRGLVTFSTH